VTESSQIECSTSVRCYYDSATLIGD